MTDEFDAYIVVSFTNATLVFSIGEEVKETNDSGFLGTVSTVHTQLLQDSSLLQVRHATLLCHHATWHATVPRTISMWCKWAQGMLVQHHHVS